MNTPYRIMIAQPNLDLRRKNGRSHQMRPLWKENAGS
jgi:hypothetical protein